MHLLLSGEFPFDHADRSELEDLIIDADLSCLRCCDEDSDSEGDADVEDVEDEAAARKEKRAALKRAWRRR